MPAVGATVPKAERMPFKNTLSPTTHSNRTDRYGYEGSLQVCSGNRSPLSVATTTALRSQEPGFWIFGGVGSFADVTLIVVPYDQLQLDPFAPA